MVATGIDDWISDRAQDAWNSVTSAPKSIFDGISFASDPLGWMLGKVQDGVDGLSTVILPALNEATHPDLSVAWFLDAYRLSFGLAMLVYIVLLVIQWVKLTRGKITGAEMADIITVQTGKFIIGCMWGPWAGWLLVQMFSALSNFFVRWGISDNTGETLQQIHDLSGQVATGSTVWGVLVSLGVLIAMLVALVLIMVAQIVALVTLYFTGVLVPLGQVWRIDPERRGMADKLLWVWLGVLAAHSLMFFLLGIAFRFSLTTMSTLFNQTPDLQALASVCAAVIAIFIASTCPVLLFKFAPILPTTAGQAMPSANNGGGGDSGPAPSSPNDVSKDQSNADPGEEGGGGGDVTDGSEAPAGSSSGNGGSGGSGSGKGSGSETSSPMSEASKSGSSVEEPAPAGAETPAPGGASAAGDSAGGAAGGGASTAAVGGEAAETAMAAGAAESATGVGAAVGIPTMLAAGAEMAGEKVGALAGAGADQATADMGEHSGGQ